MDAALAGLIGAGIGASTTLVGGVLAARHQSSQEKAKWLRERKEAAYNNAIRSVLRARNRRSGMSAEGMTYIGKEDIGKFFDDAIDAQHWLAMLTTVCGEAQRPALVRASQELDRFVGAISDTGPRAWGKKGSDSAMSALVVIYDELLAAARTDLGTTP